MFSMTAPLHKISVFTMFLRVLKDSNLLSTKANPNPKKPLWTSKNVKTLYSQISKQNKEELELWANAENPPSYSHSPSFMKKQRRKELAKLERRAFLMTQPTYVTSFTHFVSLNMHRADRDKTPQQKMRQLSGLFKKEKEMFQMEQMAKLAKRRAAAERFAIEAKDELDEAKRALLQQQQQAAEADEMRNNNNSKKSTLVSEGEEESEAVLVAPEKKKRIKKNVEQEVRRGLALLAAEPKSPKKKKKTSKTKQQE